jgi:hypothetical protein
MFTSWDKKRKKEPTIATWLLILSCMMVGNLDDAVLKYF